MKAIVRKGRLLASRLVASGGKEDFENWIQKSCLPFVQLIITSRKWNEICQKKREEKKKKKSAGRGAAAGEP